MFINILLENTSELYKNIQSFCKQFDGDSKHEKVCLKLLDCANELNEKARHLYSGNCTQDVLFILGQLCSLCDDCHYLTMLLKSKSVSATDILRTCTSIKRMCKKHMLPFKQMITDCEK